MTMDSLFDDHYSRPTEKPPLGQRETHRVLITVKAAPNPSATHGETVCVAGVILGSYGVVGWIRLYPINFRHLESDKFKKYDIVIVDCKPANEPRLESWRPVINSLQIVDHLPPWKKRQSLLEPIIENSMCKISADARKSSTAPSLALVRPAEVLDFEVESHPGWTREEQLKIDQYVNQLDIFDQTDRTPLEAPRFRGFYRWRCADPGCKGHRQSIIDWEFVAFQRNIRDASDEEVRDALRRRFLDQICRSDNDVAFFVGNQAKRHHTFLILGVYYPRVSN